MYKGMLSKAIKIFLVSCEILFCINIHASPLTRQEVTLHQVQTQLRTLQKNLNRNHIQQTNLQNQLQQNEIKISELNLQINYLDQKYQIENNQLIKLKTKQQHFINSFSLEQKHLARQALVLYSLEKNQRLKTLLNSDDVNSIERHIYYYRYLTNTHAHLLKEIKQALIILNNNVAAITAHEAHLKKLLAQKHQEQSQLKLAQIRRQSIILQLNTQTQNQQQQIDALIDNQKNLQNILKNLKIEPVMTLPKLSFHQLRGKLQWPITDAHRPIRTPQLGAIMKAPEGTPVHAIAGGKVIFATWMRGYGLLVIISHGNGYMSLYARNQALYTKVGDIIKPRQVIASIGNTGGYNQSSLYFEVRQNGQALNPAIWCR